MAGLSRPFCLSPVDHWPVPLSLATTDGISLMSVPPGTEMFQFPGFASYHYGFMVRYPRGWVAPFGYPRIKACSRLPVAFRSVPRPSSPPGAKASTECPYHTPIQGMSRLTPDMPTMHGNHRQTSCFSTRPGFRLRERGVSPVPVCRRYRRISINHLRHGTRIASIP